MCIEAVKCSVALLNIKPNNICNNKYGETFKLTSNIVCDDNTSQRHYSFSNLFFEFLCAS